MVSRFSVRSHAHVIARLAIAVLTSIVIAHPLAAQPPPPTRPQPLDPLTPAERRQAEEIARADGRVKELLGGGRTRLVYVDFIAIKSSDASPAPDTPTRPTPIGRHAEVVFYRYDDDSGVRAIVDLPGRAVAQAATIESAQVPLNAEEVNDAMALALRNQAVTSLLGADATTFQVSDTGRGARPRNVVRALRVVATGESDPCWKHRCVQLFFRRGDVYMTDSVVVDLTAQQSRVERGQR